MIKVLKKGIQNKLKPLISDFNKSLVAKDQILEYPKRLWFKGSRYR